MFEFHYLLVLAVIYPLGTSVDVSLTCPEKWAQGESYRLTCAVDRGQWAQPNPCKSSFSYTVSFSFKQAGSSTSTVCTVSSVDSACNGLANADGCGCTRTTTHYDLFYNVTANKATHENGNWGCQPDCFDGSKNPLTTASTSGCAPVKFPDPCDGNPCSPGICTVINDKAQCDCKGTSFTGTYCKDNPCSSREDGSCAILVSAGQLAQEVPIYGHTMDWKKCLAVTTNDNCSQIGALVLITVLCAVLPVLIVFGVLYLGLIWWRRTMTVKLDPTEQYANDMEAKERLLRDVNHSIHEETFSKFVHIQVDATNATIEGRNYFIQKNNANLVKAVINKSLPGSYDDLPYSQVPKEPPAYYNGPANATRMEMEARRVPRPQPEHTKTNPQ